MAHDWKRWFTGYAADAEREDPKPLAARYGAQFLTAAPAGVATFPNDEAFLGWLRQVRKANVDAGLVSMQVRSAREQPLGAAFALVTVTWEVPDGHRRRADDRGLRLARGPGRSDAPRGPVIRGLR